MRVDPGPNDTNLIRRCVVLRRKPLSQFTTEDLRLMLGQQIAVPILLPMAVAVLADDPFAEGNYYPGDLLHNVVRLPEEAWDGAGRLRDRLVPPAPRLASEDSRSKIDLWRLGAAWATTQAVAQAEPVGADEAGRPPSTGRPASTRRSPVAPATVSRPARTKFARTSTHRCDREQWDFLPLRWTDDEARQPAAEDERRRAPCAI